ncbi:MAG: hypothetical protein IJF78_16030 [Clostridia bacterium]|nr:hypothetical protein [Clostridia bacterium]
MKKKAPGYAGAVITAVCLLLYEIGLAAVFLMLPPVSLWIRILFCLIPAVISALIIYVLVQRIREIRSGESDDLDQY